MIDTNNNNSKSSFELTANLETSSRTQEPNAHISLINASIEDGDTSRASEVFKQMIDTKVQKKDTYTSLSNVCTEKQNKEGLQYASEELRNDREVVGAVKQHEETFEEELKNDREVSFTTAEQEWSAFTENFFEEMNNTREVVLAAIQGREPRTSSGDLKGDRGSVLAIIQQDGWALQYASEELRNDREFVLAAVKQNGRALACASEELRNDREVVLAAVKQNGNALKFASEELRNNRKVVLAAVKQNGRVLASASEELRNNRKVVLAAVKQNGGALRYASKELRSDRKVLLAAAKQRDGEASLIRF